MTQLKSYQKRGPDNPKIAMESWYYAKHLISLLRDEGLSLAQISAEVGSPPGWTDAARTYRYVVTERDLSKLEELAVSKGIDLNQARIDAATKGDAADGRPTKKRMNRGPLGRKASRTELRKFRTQARSLKDAGMSWGDISEAAGYTSRSGIYPALQGNNGTSYKHVEALDNFYSSWEARQAPQLPVEREIPVMHEPDQVVVRDSVIPLDSRLEVIKGALQQVTLQIRDLSKGLPRRWARDLEDNVVAYIDMAVAGLSPEGSEEGNQG